MIIYCFRPSHCYEAQLTSITEELQLVLAGHRQVYLDYSKAFLSTPEEIIFHSVVYLADAWLTKISQRVVIDGCESKYVRVWVSKYVSMLGCVPCGWCSSHEELFWAQ